MDRQATIPSRLESPITSNLDNLQAKKNFSVSHLLDLEEAGEMVGSQADESVGEAGRSMLESPGLTSGSDTTQQESKSSAEPGRDRSGPGPRPGPRVRPFVRLLTRGNVQFVSRRAREGSWNVWGSFGRARACPRTAVNGASSLRGRCGSDDVGVK